MYSIMAQAGQLGPLSGWSFEHILIAIVIFAAAVGVLFILLKVFGITLPQWFINILLILVAAVIGILAIKFLFTLW